MLKGPQTATNNFLIKQLPKATVFINKKFEIVYASDRWFKDFQFESSDVIGKSITELFTTVSHDWENILQNCLSGKADEASIDCNLGTSIGQNWFEWTCIPWYDEDENIIGLIIQTENITQQKLNNDKVNKLESLLQSTSEIAKIGSWEYDVIEDELTWCKMTRKIHEVSDDYIPTIDTALNFYKDGYSKNTISMVVHEAMEKGTPWSEKLQVITAQGKEIWIQAAGKPIFKDEKLIMLIGTFQDIDNQIRSEAKTKENEQLLRTVVDNLPLNVFIKDTESRKILVNKSECNYLGVENSEELLGKTDFEMYDAEIAQISRAEDLKVMDTLTPMIGKETVSRTRNGKITTFLTSKIPLKGNDGRASGLVGISLDISDIKQKEEELRDLINVTSQQNKKLINFAHIVSHNLRSHTANFSMLLDFLVNENDESEKENILQMLTDASDNLLETLENLNEVVAINTNVSLEKESVNLNAQIDIVQKHLTAFLRNNNAHIVNTISDEVEINVVPEYLDSILMNFITNSIKYKAPERNPTVKLSAERKDGCTILSIADNGLGIDLEKYGNKLFGMYKTFHSHTDARGIGLYITKNQIEAMNGRVTVSSKVGSGTTFNIYFNEKN